MNFCRGGSFSLVIKSMTFLRMLWDISGVYVCSAWLPLSEKLKMGQLDMHSCLIDSNAMETQF